MNCDTPNMAPSNPSATAPFTIASWNVHMGLHNDWVGARGTKNRGPLNDVVSRCKEIDADVLVLQEAYWWRQGPEAQSAEPEEREEIPELLDEVATAVGGTVHRFSSTIPHRYFVPWTIAVITRVPATRLDNAPLPASRGHERGMIRVRLDDVDVIVAGGHHDGVHAIRDAPRRWIKQMRVLRTAADTNDIVVGDMNMWGPVLTRGMPGLRRAVLGRTWPAWRPHSQIDHILVNDRIDVVGGEVLPNFDSDHLPIKATLRVRP